MPRGDKRGPQRQLAARRGITRRRITRGSTRGIAVAAASLAAVVLAILVSGGSLALAASPPATSPEPLPSGSAHFLGPWHPAHHKPAAAVKGQTVVTFAWGGGLADQMPSLPLFAAHGMHATYFVPSGLVCLQTQARCAATSPYLTIRDLHQIVAGGNEIGGLGVLHQRLTTTSAAEAQREICDDRVNLLRWGFHPTDFAYPFAALNPAVQALVRQCGYDAGLGTGTLRGAGRCTTCARAESIPPKNPWNVRTPVEVNSVHTTWTARTYESIVENARRHGGGWVIFTIHDICATNCNLGTTAGVLDQVLTWLHRQAAHNTVVRTMSQVIGGRTRPPVAGPAPRAQRGVVNGDLASASGGHPACFQEASYGGVAASFTYHPTGGPRGSAAETVRMSRSGSGNAKLLPVMDLGRCAPSVSPGHTYTARVMYTASRRPQFEVYRRTPRGAWVYWTTSPTFPASASWRPAEWKTPDVPTGTTALSFGLTTSSASTVTTTDYSLAPVKSHRAIILLAGLIVVLVAAGLITHGHYRYARYLKAEAAEEESMTAEKTGATS